MTTPFNEQVDEILARHGLDTPGYAMLASDLADLMDSTQAKPDPYVAFEAWATEQGYDLDDSAQLWAAVKAYFDETGPAVTTPAEVEGC